MSKIKCGVVILEGENYRDEQILYEGLNVVGRNEAKSTITIKDKSISTVHAKIIVKDQTITVLDAGSKNGVFFNLPDQLLENNVETKIDPANDVVYFAQIKCKFLPNWLHSQKDEAYDSNKLAGIFKEEEKPNRQKQQIGPKQKIGNKKSDEFKQSTIMELMLDTEDPQNQVKKEANQSKEEQKINKKKPKSKDAERSRNTSKGSKASSEDEIQIKDEKKRKKKGLKKQTKNEVVIENYDEEKSESEQDNKSKNRKEESKKKESNYEEKQKQIGKAKDKSKSKHHDTSDEKEKGKDVKTKSFYSKRNDEKKSYSGETKGRKNENNEKNSKSLKEKKEIKENMNLRKKSPKRESSPGERNRRRQGKKYALESGYKLSFTPSVRIIIVEDWREYFDVLIMDKYVRTFKLLLAICKGVPIVRPNWVFESEYTRGICPLEKYLIQCPERQTILESIEKVKNGFKVFESQIFYLLEEENRFHLPKECIEVLIETGGGEIVQNLEAISSKKSKKFVFVVSNDYGHQELKTLKSYPNNKAYKIEFILNACFSQALKWEENEVVKLK